MDDRSMNAPSRGAAWFAALTAGSEPHAGFPASVRVCDAALGGVPARYIAVVPDPDNPFPRARHGETGLIEGWQLARAVRQAIDLDRDCAEKRAIVAVVDVTRQAYGRREEGYGIHQALAAAAAAYAEARLAGHAVIGLIVGKAMSGAFLAHGYQANRLIAVNDPEVMVHAMGKASAARITMRSVEALERLSSTIAPMAYDIASYASLGLLWQRLTLRDPGHPTAEDIATVDASLQAALQDIQSDPARNLAGRLGAANRSASKRVRDMLRAQWQA